jgi:hypothetical protein
MKGELYRFNIDASLRSGPLSISRLNNSLPITTMKYLHPIIISLLSCLLAVACTGRKGKDRAPATVSAGQAAVEVPEQPVKNLVREADFPPAEREGVPLYIEAVLHPARMQTDGTNLYVACFNCDTMIYVFSLPDLHLRQSFGIKGQGPEDFLFPAFCSAAGREIALWGFADFRRIVRYDTGPDGIGAKKGEIRLTENKAYNQSQLVRDSFFVYNLLPQGSGIGKIDLYNGMALVQKEYPLDQAPEDIFYSSNQGSVAASGAGIAYLFYYRNEIDFYDPDLNLLSSKTSANNRIHIEKRNHADCIIYYHQFFAGDRYLYALTHGGRQRTLAGASSSSLETYDWAGHLIARYSLTPAVELFVVDETTRTLYGYNVNDPDAIYKYDL